MEKCPSGEKIAYMTKKFAYGIDKYPWIGYNSNASGWASDCLGFADETSDGSDSSVK